ncbi:MAG: multiple sugar transport system ATP-binding protein [Candidatus Atribacteria bacterium]|nr:multiple sugar transport system ATP-binding protein [Candidatus Atribacteria bacterium]
MSSVRVEHLSKRFGKVEAVKEVSFQVEEGEFIVLLGPSGCGKTTTLRCIAGLEVPDSGRIFFDQEDVTLLGPSARNIAFVFQLYALYPHLSVYDNVAFPLRAEGLPKKEVEERTEEVLKLLQIDDIKHQKPRKLTGGQRQRVALGRAIVRRPRVFLLDEPLSNIDAKLREITRGELKKLQRSIKATTIYVTHDQVEAMTMADKIVVMNFGDIQQIGSPHEVYHYPANLFVARFIGSPGMNFIPGELLQKERLGVMINDSYFIPLEKEQIQIIEEKDISRKVILGVRPENIILTEEDIEGAIKAEVYVFEPLGAENVVTFRINEHLVKAVLPGDMYLSRGEIVNLHFKEIRVFDTRSEKLIA